MVYEPREDSYLLEKQVKKFAKGKVLDIGTGTGILAEAAAKKAKKVLAVDIDEESINYCKKNIKNRKITFKKSDLFKNVKTSFDTIIFNPPYLPLHTKEPKSSRTATTGGKHGYELIDKFLKQANDYLNTKGKILIVFSSLTKQEKVEDIIEKYGFVFKKLAKKKIHFEELYVYLIERAKFLDKIRSKVKNIERFAKGTRSVVYQGFMKNKKVVVKVEGNTKAMNRIKNEAKFLKKLNKKHIGPKLYFSNAEYVVMEYIEGQPILVYLQGSNANQIKRTIREAFEQCYIMDLMKLNKEEMHRPIKHLIIRNNKPVFIDFEKCRTMLRPQNVTQFCQFLMSGNFSYGLETKGLRISKKIIKFAQKYKKEPIRRNFELILEEISR